MAGLLLSGGGYSSDNWLPLVTPLVVIALLLYAGELGLKMLKRRRLLRKTGFDHRQAPEPGTDDAAEV